MLILPELYAAVRNLDDLTLACTDLYQQNQLVSVRNNLCDLADELVELSLTEDSEEISEAITALQQLGEAGLEAKKNIHNEGVFLTDIYNTIEKASTAIDKIAALRGKNVLGCNIHGSGKGE